MPLITRLSALKDGVERAEVMLKAFKDDPIRPYILLEVPYKDQVAILAGSLEKGFGDQEYKDLEIVDTETECETKLLTPLTETDVTQKNRCFCSLEIP
jgi:hypothetical protein